MAAILETLLNSIVMEQHFLNVQNSYAHSRVHITLRKDLEQILPCISGKLIVEWWCLRAVRSRGSTVCVRYSYFGVYILEWDT